MATIKQVVGTRTSLGTMNTLASAGYTTVGTLTHNTNQPLDVLIEVTVSPGTTTGNKQAVVFAQSSLDGTNFTTWTTNVADEPDLYQVGVVPLNTASTVQTKTFSLAAAFGGKLPYASKIIIKNDSGASFAGSGNTVYYSEISATVA
jgi:hypothetical protein